MTGLTYWGVAMLTAVVSANLREATGQSIFYNWEDRFGILPVLESGVPSTITLVMQYGMPGMERTASRRQQKYTKRRIEKNIAGLTCYL